MSRGIIRRCAIATATVVLGMSVPLMGQNAAPSINADSISYVSMRQSAVTAHADEQLLQTADELATQWLFTDARELLRELMTQNQSGDTTATTTILPRNTPPIRWRISTGVDYYHLEDVDTIAMTSEELRDYKRLTETPLAWWMRAGGVITPSIPAVKTIEPEAYISQRKVRLSARGKMSFLEGSWLIEPSLKTEKWFGADASDTSSFDPFAKQSSDMGELALRVTPQNRQDRDGEFSWSLPIAIDWEQYRNNRPGYESSVEYCFSPSVEFDPYANGFSISTGAEIRFEDFYGEGGADSLDIVRLSIRAAGTLRPSWGPLSVFGAYRNDRYTVPAHLYETHRGELTLRFDCFEQFWLSPRISSRYIYEAETQRNDMIAGSTRIIDGSQVSGEPALEITVNEVFSVEPRIVAQKRWATVNLSEAGSPFLWEARTVLEPGLRIGLIFPGVDLSLRGAFRWEDVDADFEQFLADSRSLKAGADASMELFGKLTVSLIAEYQHRTYAPFGNNSRVSENVSLSGSVLVKL